MHEKVSLCLVVRNEEKNVRECLEPLVSLFSEIIVVDTGSEDRTKEVAIELGARVIEFPWCDDFSAARNEMLRHATGEWIFWLDADDRLDTASILRLHDLMQALPEENAAYIFEVASLPQYQADGATLISQVRLFRNHRDACWTGRVHEQILPQLQDLNYKAVSTGIRIHHLGYQDPLLHRRKINRDMRLLRMEYAVSPEDPWVLFNLGMTHMRLSQYHQAIDYFSNCLVRASSEKGDWLRVAYRALAVALCTCGKIHESLAALSQGLERFPDDVELLYVSSRVSYDARDYATAERCLHRIMKLQPHHHLQCGGMDGQAQKESRRLLACVYMEQNRLLEAERVLQELLAEHPDYSTGWVSLAKFYLQHRRFHELEYAIRQLECCPQGEVLSMVMRASYLIERRDFETAYYLLQQVIARDPQLVWAHLVLAKLLERWGTNREQYASVLKRIMILDPCNDVIQAKLNELNAVRTAPPKGNSHLNSNSLSWTINVNV